MFCSGMRTEHGTACTWPRPHGRSDPRSAPPVAARSPLSCVDRSPHRHIPLPTPHTPLTSSNYSSGDRTPDETLRAHMDSSPTRSTCLACVRNTRTQHAHTKTRQAHHTREWSARTVSTMHPPPPPPRTHTHATPRAHTHAISLQMPVRTAPKQGQAQAERTAKLGDRATQSVQQDYDRVVYRPRAAEGALRRATPGGGGHQGMRSSHACPPLRFITPLQHSTPIPTSHLRPRATPDASTPRPPPTRLDF